MVELLLTIYDYVDLPKNIMTVWDYERNEQILSISQWYSERIDFMSNDFMMKEMNKYSISLNNILKELTLWRYVVTLWWNKWRDIEYLSITL